MIGQATFSAIDENLEATVANGGTTSTKIALGGARTGSFKIPSAFTGTNCAVQISIDGTNFTSVLLQGNETVTVAAGGTYAMPEKSCAAKYIRFLVDAQAAARTITVFLRS